MRTLSARNAILSCRKKVNLFAKEHYDGDIVELWRDTHHLYMSMATKLTKEAISAYEKQNEAIIKKYGWAQYAWSSLEQGWWHFVDYIINKNQQ